ncbi:MULTISPECIES: nuclear transport factor 2 family protein [Mycolicibacterium]|uniref:nuclear transport factor 2 family protein n=1 Tax=Mycolicibacterium TaxID=1866885 RepID=UPI00148F8679|nr:nuclear transport factor 2 family protein [Mycolicibacterium fortuitum]
MTSDYEQILAVHRGWYESNVGLDAEKMLQFFPCGDNYHQFNLNGWTYSGVLDKHELWINLNKSGFDITMQRDVVGPDVQIFGDVALVTAEGVVELVLPADGGTQAPPTTAPFRITEFLRRDDGLGNPVWTIWHMHVSGAEKSMPKHGTR